MFWFGIFFLLLRPSVIFISDTWISSQYESPLSFHEIANQASVERKEIVANTVLLLASIDRKEMLETKNTDRNGKQMLITSV